MIDEELKQIYLDSKYISNKEIYTLIKDIITCSICMGILISPKQCSTCENYFCNFCIENWLKFKNECPYRCKDFLLREPSRILYMNLELIQFKCPNECDSSFSYSLFIPHMKECVNKIKCWNCNCLADRTKLKISNKDIYYEDIEKKYIILEKVYKELKDEYEEYRIKNDMNHLSKYGYELLVGDNERLNDTYFVNNEDEFKLCSNCNEPNQSNNFLCRMCFTFLD